MSLDLRTTRRKPSLIISTLEALAVFLATDNNLPQRPPTYRHPAHVEGQPCQWSRVQQASDNAVPCFCIENGDLDLLLSCSMVEWTPRSWNTEADALANGDASAFGPSLEIAIDEDLGGAAGGTADRERWPTKTRCWSKTAVCSLAVRRSSAGADLKNVFEQLIVGDPIGARAGSAHLGDGCYDGRDMEVVVPWGGI